MAFRDAVPPAKPITKPEEVQEQIEEPESPEPDAA